LEIGATNRLSTPVRPMEYARSASLCSRSASILPVSRSRAKYTTPPPSDRLISPSISNRPRVASWTAWTRSSFFHPSPAERSLQRSTPHCVQKRAHPRTPAPHFGQVVGGAGTVVSSWLATSSKYSLLDASPCVRRKATSFLLDTSRAR